MKINAYMNRGGEQYVAPQMEIVDLSCENVICGSCTGYCTDCQTLLPEV